MNPTRHSHTDQVADHRVPGSLLSGLGNLFAPRRLASNFVGDAMIQAFGANESQKYAGVLHAENGLFDDILTKTAEAKSGIERMIGDLKVSKSTRSKFMAAVNAYEDAYIRELLYASLLTGRTTPTAPTSEETGIVDKVTSFLSSLLRQKDFPVAKAIQALESRADTMTQLEMMLSNLPKNKQTQEIVKALTNLKTDLSKSITQFTTQLSGIAKEAAKASQSVQSKSAARRQLGVEVDAEKEEAVKEFQGMFSNLVSTALSAQGMLGGGAPAGLGALTGLGGLGNKLISSTIQNSLLNQVQSMTGLPVATLSRLISTPTQASGAAGDAINQVKNLFGQVSSGVSGATSSQGDMTKQMSAINDLVKNKLGGASGLMDVLKKELGPAAEQLLTPQTKMLLAVVEALEEEETLADFDALITTMSPDSEDSTEKVPLLPRETETEILESARKQAKMNVAAQELPENNIHGHRTTKILASLGALSEEEREKELNGLIQSLQQEMNESFNTDTSSTDMTDESNSVAAKQMLAVEDSDFVKLADKVNEQLTELVATAPAGVAATIEIQATELPIDPTAEQVLTGADAIAKLTELELLSTEETAATADEELLEDDLTTEAELTTTAPIIAEVAITLAEPGTRVVQPVIVHQMEATDKEAEAKLSEMGEKIDDAETQLAKAARGAGNVIGDAANSLVQGLADFGDSLFNGAKVLMDDVPNAQGTQ